MKTGWGSPLVTRSYRHAGWSDPGEDAAVQVLVAAGHPLRVLDVGVGGGRTVDLLARLASEYTGIDSSPRMVSLAHELHPVADIRLGDARDLGAFADGSRDLVVFSFNGIDALTHDEHVVFLREAHRVLADNGHLLFSTLNLDGGGYLEHPSLAPVRDALHHAPFPRSRAHTSKAVVGAVARLLIGVRYYLPNRLRAERHDDWAMAPLAAHEFRFVVHFSSLTSARTMLADAGFTAKGVWTNTAQRVPDTAIRYDENYAHFLCSKA